MFKQWEQQLDTDPQKMNADQQPWKTSKKELRINEDIQKGPGKKRGSSILVGPGPFSRPLHKDQTWFSSHT